MESNRTLNPLEPGVVSLLGAAGYSPGGVASRPILQTPSVRVVWMGLDVGQELTEHTTPRRALIEILEGNCEFLLGTAWKSVGPGDLIHLTPGLIHAVKAKTRTSFLLIMVPETTPVGVPDAGKMKLVSADA